MNMHVNTLSIMEIMDPTGHTTVTWDPREPKSVADARREFDRLTRNGYQAFNMNIVSENGVVVEEKGQLTRTFDPQAGKLMMVPHLVAG